MGLDRRGVSETISFVLVFSLIVASVGIVYTVGFASLQEARDHERINNAERAFSVLAENIEDIRRHGAPSRATEIKLAGAQLFIGDPIQVKVTGDFKDGQSDPEDFSTGNVSVKPIVYRANSDDSIRYVNGAIIRSSGPNSAIMLRSPAALTHPSRTLIPILQTTGPTGEGVGGDITAHVRTLRNLGRVLVGHTETYDTVTITIHSPHATVWKEYFEQQGVACSGSDEKMTCRLRNVERLYLVLVRITVRIE